MEFEIITPDPNLAFQDDQEIIKAMVYGSLRKRQAEEAVFAETLVSNLHTQTLKGGAGQRG